MSETEASKNLDESEDVSSLSEMFDKAFKLYNDINKTQESTNSLKVQSAVKKTMSMFEDATRLVSLANMFSDNETFEEVPTENIKYFFLPALLGTLTLKICGSNDRSHIVDVAEIYFVDFLKRVKAYGLTDIDIPDIKLEENVETQAVEQRKSNAELITEMVNKRQAKLQRYKEQKELETRLDILQKNMDNPNVDDETKREYYVTLVKIFVHQAIEELGALALEKQLLSHMKLVKSKEGPEVQKHHKGPSQGPKLQPIIITKDKMQKQVFGAGYPSLPVYTVEEFYEQRIKDGDWPDSSHLQQKFLQDVANSPVDGITAEEKEEIEKEKKIEEDDPELLAQTRAMDEYKDTHRRGWGNRANRS